MEMRLNASYAQARFSFLFLCFCNTRAFQRLEVVKSLPITQYRYYNVNLNN